MENTFPLETHGTWVGHEVMHRTIAQLSPKPPNERRTQLEHNGGSSRGLLPVVMMDDMVKKTSLENTTNFWTEADDTPDKYSNRPT